MAFVPLSATSSSANAQMPTPPLLEPPDIAPVIFCDTVQSLGMHNGVVRISFIRLDADGKALPALDLLLPVTQTESFTRALSAVGRQSSSATSPN